VVLLLRRSATPGMLTTAQGPRAVFADAASIARLTQRTEALERERDVLSARITQSKSEIDSLGKRVQELATRTLGLNSSAEGLRQQLKTGAHQLNPRPSFQPICQVTFGRAVCMRGNDSVKCPERPQAGAVPGQTGAWELPESYVYFMDRGLVGELKRLVGGGAVIEFGAGKGCYAAALRAEGVEVRAFDGSPHIANQTDGLVQTADLTTALHVGQAPWVLCLETAEHIPREHESALLGNLERAAHRGVVLSWSNNEGGNGHVMRTHGAGSYLRACGARAEVLCQRWHQLHECEVSSSMQCTRVE